MSKMPKITEKNFENDITTLKKLIQERSQLKETSKQMMELYQELESERHALLQRLDELNDGLEQCTAADFENVLDAEEFTKDITGKLENHSFILGYRVTDLEVTELNTQLVTFEEGEKFILHQIYPKHPNFDAIKNMLYETSDITGLLTTLRKYFDLIIKIQLEENKTCVNQGV